MNDIALYELSSEYRANMEALSSLDLDDQTFQDTIESLSGDIEVKATEIIKIACNLEVSAEAIEEAEKKMAARRRAIEKRSERIRQYVLACMINAGVKKIECPFFSVAVRENPPKVVIDDARQIPMLYMTDPPIPKPVPDKKLIAIAIKDGTNIPGVHLERGKRLEIQ